MIFEGVDTQLFFSRNDPADPRLGDHARALPAMPSIEAIGGTAKEIITTGDENEKHFFIAGYADDEGIRANGGRMGAAQAPSEVRRALYKMTPPLFPAHPWQARIWDLGNLKSRGLDLQSRHEMVSRASRSVLDEGASWIAIGGGHDYGFPDADSFCGWCESQESTKPLIINFDAHLDVRPTDRGLSSGTPFFRMLEKYPDCDFAEIGIQGHCNSRTHLEWVKSRGARVLTQEERFSSGEPLVTAAVRLLGDWILRPRPVFLSVDIDGFSSTVAPGCSQSWATGFMPEEFFQLFDVLSSRLDVRMLGIYEVSPPLDQDNRTAKLAAQIIHRVMS